MSEAPDACHLSSCDRPLQTLTLCEFHAERLLAPLAPLRPLRKPPAPAEAERKAA